MREDWSTPCTAHGSPAGRGAAPTFDGQQDHPRVVVGDDVGVAVLGLVHLQVGVLPGELLPRVDGLQHWERKREGQRGGQQQVQLCSPWLWGRMQPSPITSSRNPAVPWGTPSPWNSSCPIALAPGGISELILPLDSALKDFQCKWGGSPTGAWQGPECIPQHKAGVRTRP